MARKRMFVEVRGKNHRWSFDTTADTKYLPEWHADGLEIHVIENSIPAWLPAWVPAQAWCFAQDLFNFRNPWRKD